MVQELTVFVDNEGSSGSGFFIDLNYVATCAHVVREARQGKIPSIWGTEEGKMAIGYEVVARGYEGDNDIAILKVKTSEISKIGRKRITRALGTSGVRPRRTPIESGEPIMICGYPPIATPNPLPILTSGVVSTAPLEKRERLVVSASIQPGNSGGPCFDATGRILGLATTSLGFGTVEVFTQGGKVTEPLPRHYGEVVPILRVRSLAILNKLSIPWLRPRKPK